MGSADAYVREVCRKGSLVVEGAGSLLPVFKNYLAFNHFLYLYVFLESSAVEVETLSR